MRRCSGRGVVELRLVHALNPPPATISWLVTSVFWLGSAGVIVILVILGLLVPRLAAVRYTALAAVITWGVCLLPGEILGPSAGRPATDSLAGVDAKYPVTQLAVTMAVAATALPYLSRPLHRLATFLIAMASIAAVIEGAALPRSAPAPSRPPRAGPRRSCCSWSPSDSPPAIYTRRQIQAGTRR